LSAIKDKITRSGKKRNVRTPSQTSTTFSELTIKMNMSHKYAKMEKDAVMLYTCKPSILRCSPLGMQLTQTAEMQSKLKAALPTIVEGPNSPLKNSLPSSSITLSKISGALEPSAISVKLETVSFQTGTVKYRPVFKHLLCMVLEVMRSMAPMNTSDTIATPMKHHKSPRK
jgi:hypothetical protein